MVKDRAPELLPGCTQALLLLATRTWEELCLPGPQFLHLQNRGNDQPLPVGSVEMGRGTPVCEGHSGTLDRDFYPFVSHVSDFTP